jgi:hypothetical protein
MPTDATSAWHSRYVYYSDLRYLDHPINYVLSPKLVDDILDHESSETTLGKPGGADLQLGLATGPALFAWEEHPEMGPLIRRKFSQEGDVELVSAT